MALKQAVAQKIINDVLAPLKVKNEWKVLVVDHLAMRITSSCCKMHEILNLGVTLVEDLNKRREPLPTIDAIYLVTPTEASVLRIVEDFKNPHNKLYRNVHLFFTEACPEELFNKMCHENVAKTVKTLKEINVAFLPYESQVFSLDFPSLFQIYFDPERVTQQVRQQHLERCAEQIATLCATLGEYPMIRYRVVGTPTEWNQTFAHIVQNKLDQYKADDPSMGDGPHKANTQLIILDRGFDPVTPLLHELTFQSMCYDLLPIPNDVYKYENVTGAGEVQDKEVILDENDDLWAQIRHKHIAEVSNEVVAQLKEFTKSKKLATGDKTSVRDLSQMLKKMPQHQKELSKYSTHIHLAEDCMAQYKKGIAYLCKVEQNLAMGEDEKSEKLRDQRATMDLSNVLMGQMPPEDRRQMSNEPQFDVDDKLRVLALYLIWRGGASVDLMNRLLAQAEIVDTDKCAIDNMQKLGATVYADQGRARPKQLYLPGNRRERDSHQYVLSRWTPFVRDIMEDAIGNKLDQRIYPFLQGNAARMPATSATSARYWGFGRGGQQRSVPRLLVFIVGGVTYSEMRCAYEVSKAIGNYEVIIGGSHILTPKLYLDGLKNFSTPVAQDMSLNS